MRQLVPREFEGEHRPDRRVEPRFQVGTEAILTLLKASQHSESVKVTVVDASSSGLGLLSSLPGVAGDAISLELTDCIVLGEVVYCRQVGNEYRMGVQLAEFLGKRQIADLQKSTERITRAPRQMT